MADCSDAINALVEAVEAIEHELGVTPSAVYANVRARLDILEARINNPLLPSPDVENPFFIGNTGVTISVGDGVPTEVRAPGSVYLREDGYGNNTVYARGADGIWWNVASGAVGGGPITVMRVVAKGAPANGDGSFENPYDTLEAAVTELDALAVIDGYNQYVITVFPGNYSAENDVTWTTTSKLTLQSFTSVNIMPHGGLANEQMYGDFVILPPINMTAGGELDVSGFKLFGAITSASSSIIVNVDKCILFSSINTPFGSVRINDGYMYNNTITANELDISGCRVNCTTGSWTLSSTNAAITSSHIDKINSVIFSGSAGTLKLDNYSKYSWDASASGITNGSILLVSPSASGSAGGDLTGTYPNPTIANNAVTFAKMQTIATDSLLGRDTAGTGNVETITLDSTLNMSGSQVLRRAAISGDVTIASGSNTATVTDLTISGEAQGDILYFNGTNWVRLAASTNGYVLTTHGAGSNPTWTSVSGGGGGSADGYGFVNKVYVPILSGNAITNSTIFVSLGANEFNRSLIPAGTVTIKLQVLLETTSPLATAKLYNYTTAADVTSSTVTTSSTTPVLLTSSDLYANLSSGSAIYQVQFNMASGGVSDQVTCSMARLILEWS